MVHFTGAGPGAPDLITIRGKKLLEEADIVIYAGSLVNKALLDWCRDDCQRYDSARMTLEEVMAVIKASRNKDIVRLHTGDPSVYGAIREQMDALEAEGIPYEVCPGVSSMYGAAASMGLEYTLPGVSQSVIVTRMAGRTPVPEAESIAALAAHQATMVIFLSAGMMTGLAQELQRGGYTADTPAAIVYKATWEDEQICTCTVATLAETAAAAGIDKTALIIVGEVVTHQNYARSELYHPAFSTAYRKAEEHL